MDEALGFADPCQWSPIVIAINASTPASVEVPLTKGVALTFKLIDNGVDLQRFSPAPPLSVVLTDSLGKDHLLPFVGNIENAAIYRLLTLPGEYQVAAATTQMVITDSNGKNLNGRFQATVDTANVTPLPTWAPSFLKGTGKAERVIAVYAPKQ